MIFIIPPKSAISIIWKIDASINVININSSATIQFSHFIVSMFSYFGYFVLPSLHYLLRTQYNILLLLRNATSNNHQFHSNNMSDDFVFNIKVITLITYTKLPTIQSFWIQNITRCATNNTPNIKSNFCKKKQYEDHLKLSQHINATTLWYKKIIVNKQIYIITYNLYSLKTL